MISRSGLYFRLQPRCSSSLEGKRHVKTVPVKLNRAQTDDHAKHVDGEFCTATVTHLEELSSTLGPKEVCFISQDDKCRVPIGFLQPVAQPYGQVRTDWNQGCIIDCSLSFPAGHKPFTCSHSVLRNT